jgi:hypothetical protein
MQRHQPSLVELGVSHHDHAFIQINVSERKSQHFGDPHTSTREQTQQCGVD